MPRLLLLLACATPSVVYSWVLFSPMRTTLAEKMYENGVGVGWSDPSSFNLEMVSLRWGLPPSAYESEGLAGGISFALHRDFCERMLPLFPESAEHFKASKVLSTLFLSCDDLRDTVKRAMDTWAINHRKIYFRDVSDQCADVSSLDRCDAAELFIVPDKPGGESPTKAGDLAAFVTHNTSSLDFSPYTTAGHRLNMGLGVRDAKMTVRAPETQAEFCWYLDTTFCYGFHRWGGAITWMRFLGVSIFAIAILVLVVIIAFCLHATFCSHHDHLHHEEYNSSKTLKAGEEEEQEPDLECGSRICTNLLDYVAVMPTFTLLFATFLIIVCPIFYYRIFLPCYDCYDFEATIAHEVGHVLGFHHPDRESELNLQATQLMGNATCLRALDHVELAPEKDLGDSIMYSMTTNRDRTCLTADDLEGLNYLYPTCDGTLHPREDTGEPLCIKGKRMGGWVRLAYVVFGPWLIICLVFFFLQCVVRHHQKHNRGKSMEQLHGHFADKRKGLAKKLRNAPNKDETPVSEVQVNLSSAA